MTEPVSPPPGGEAGSSQFPVMRTLAIAGLVALSVYNLSFAIFATPFIPVLVALHLRRSPTPGFVLSATLTSLIAAGAVSIDRGDPVALTVAIEAFFLLLVGPLSIVQAHASQPDEVDVVSATGPDDGALLVAEAAQLPSLPIIELPTMPEVEPRFLSGFTLVLLSWFVPMVLCIAVLLPVVGTADLQAGLSAGVRSQYRDVDKECVAGGALERQQAICSSFADNEAQVLRVVRDHVHVAIAVVAALIAFGAAWTSHQVTLWRLRAIGVRTRPKRRTRDFEVHWSMAYIAAIGLVLILTMGDPTNDFALWTRALGVAAVVFAAQAIGGQGIGLLAFSLRGLRGWRRVALIVFAVLGWEFVAPLVLVLGLVDLALHPRRRVSGSLTGRGSVS